MSGRPSMDLSTPFAATRPTRLFTRWGGVGVWVSVHRIDRIGADVEERGGFPGDAVKRRRREGGRAGRRSEPLKTPERRPACPYPKMPRVTTAGFSSVSSHFSDTVAVTSWSFLLRSSV